MKTGLGLPITNIPSLLDWARRADDGPFSTLGLLDRLVYDNPEPLVALAAIAGATERIRVQTEVLLAPLREPVLLAKQAATLHRISGGRFTLGLGVGGREDDFEAVGLDLSRRGLLLDAQLPVFRQIWSGEDPVGPSGAPEVLFGGFRPPALRRIAHWGDGFLCAAAPSWAGSLFRTVEQFWADAGRAGRPRMVGQVNVALGPDEVVDDGFRTLRAYYGFNDQVDAVIAHTLTKPAQIRDAIGAFGDLGVDEVMLYCWADDPDQVDRLAELVG
ncbi:MAG TPA: LLM class flavin-dependent oxidoreductase [Pseudonocardiaceae bacterium]|nr:LLM class flavin-dependent oxidoreductase [Pseudonocardiaceae bacterium]